MSKRSYWTGRYEELAAANQAQSAQYEQHFGSMSDVLYMQMQDELEAWYRRYGRTADMTPDDAAKTLENTRSQDWKMTLDQYRQAAIEGGHDDQLDLQYIQSRVARMQQLQEQLKAQAGHAVPTFDKDMEAELSKGYKRTYEHATYLNEQNGAVSTKADFAHYDEAALNAILHKPWAKDGKNFSKRIWGNMQDKLPDMLMESLAESVVLGHSVDQVVNRLSLKYGDFKRVNLHRLIQSEMAHIEENATFDSYADCDVDYYMYMATLESHTCDICRELDGHKYKVTDKIEGINYPPIHAYCRCTTGAWFPEMADEGKRWSRDPESNKVEQVDGQTFNQWWAEKMGQSIMPSMPARPEPQTDKNVISPKTLMSGVKLGKTMDIDRADKLHANPNFDGATPEARTRSKNARALFAQLRDQLTDARQQLDDAQSDYYDERSDENKVIVHQKITVVNETVNAYNRQIDVLNAIAKENQPYRVNCQRCAPAYELRRRGYNVNALPNSGGNWNEIYTIPEKMWRFKDGSVSEPQMLPARSNRAVTKALNKQMAVGERGTLDWAWTGGGNALEGHIINVEKTKNGLVFVDAQGGKQAATFEEYMGSNNFKKKYYGTTMGVNYNRVDDKFIDLENIGLIVKEASEND